MSPNATTNTNHEAGISMPSIAAIAEFLEQFAPPRLAEEWDNVGLLVGDRRREVGRVMTCLTVSPATAAEAVERRAELIVAHHPLPFNAVRRITADTVVGRMLLELIAAGVAVYSPHTAFDSAAEGINQRLAEGLGLTEIVPLAPRPEGQGTGRRGRLARPIILGELALRLKQFLRIERLQIVGQPEQSVTQVAIGCGAAGELLDAARTAGCDAMVLGEARFHTCLEAESLGISLLLPGHYASERFAVESLAEVLSRQFPAVEVWASQAERDPLRWN
jgi:dinuclear metal center YbgI/SA1388 family protein